jgi:hypothetical protein
MFAFIQMIISALTGGSLDRILDTIEKRLDNEVTKEEVKADITKTWINAQAALLVGRTWWFQLFFVMPAGLYWLAIILDSIFQIDGWDVAKLPPPMDDVFGLIISALFMVDAGKALIGRFKK